MSRTRPTKAELAARDEAIAKLRELCPPGTTVYTVPRHVSRSGMMRHVDFYVMQDNEPRYISGLVEKATTFHDGAARDGSLKIGGCGMDVGLQGVYSLASRLYPDGFECLGKGDGTHGSRCPSNDHSNGDREYTPHIHTSGGYALRHRWM